MLPLSRMIRLASLPTLQQASLPTLQQAQLLSTASGHKASVDSRWLSLFLSRSFLTLLIRHPIDSVTRGLPSFLSAKYWDLSPWPLFLVLFALLELLYSTKDSDNYFKTVPPGRVPVTLIPGDGVGPEIMDSTKEVLNRMGAKVHICDLGFSKFQTFLIVGWKLFSFCLWKWEETQFKKHPVCGHLWIATLHRLTLRRFTFLK